jgi:hypothetical protein
MKKTFILIILLTQFQINYGQQLKSASVVLNLDSGMVAYYPFEENPFDASGNGKDGTICGTAEYLTGITGKGIRLEGTSNNFGMTGEGDHVLLPAFDFTNTQELTFSLWVKEESMSYWHGTGYIFFGDAYGGNANIGHWGDFYNSQSYIGFAAGGTNASPTNDPNYPETFFMQSFNGLNRWVHYAMTYKNDTLKAYINGVYVGGKYQKLKIWGSNAGLACHWWSYGGDISTRFTGMMDEVRIYSRNLDAAEVDSLFRMVHNPNNLVVDAGKDSTVQEGALVRLDGTHSVDLSGKTIRFKWQAPDSIVLSSDTVPKPTFIAPQIDLDTSLKFLLTVSDKFGNSAMDTVLIYVKNINSGTLIDSLALVALYNATGGPNWKNKSNWLSNQPIRTWFGVNVSGDRVVGLSLGANNLISILPPEIGNLSCLKSLILSNNSLSGELPDSIFSLSKLVKLDLGRNKLSGTISPKIGQLSNLSTLVLSNNQLSGSLPVEISNLIKLSIFYLGNNNISGNIIPEIGQLISLNQLDLQYNNFEGKIPVQICQTPLNTVNFTNNLLNSESCPAITCLKNKNVQFIGDSLQTQKTGLKLIKACQSYSGRSLLITEARMDVNYNAYAELTNMGTTPLNLSEFEFGLTHNLSVQPSKNWLRLPNKILFPGKSFVIACVLDYGPEQYALGKENFPERLTKTALLKSADLQVHIQENSYVDGTDSISSFQYLMKPVNGTFCWYVEYHPSLKDSVIVDQVNGVFNPVNGNISGVLNSVAGVPSASGTCILFRKFSVKEGETNFDTTRGTSLSDSKWIPIPHENRYADWRDAFWTIGNHGDYHLTDTTLISDQVNIDFRNRIVRVPWGTRNKDGIMRKIRKVNGVAWRYNCLRSPYDSLFMSAKTGDKLEIYVCGNELDTASFNIIVDQPADSTNLVVSKYHSTNLVNQMVSGQVEWPRVTENGYGPDTISGIQFGLPFATRIDTLYKYLEKAPGATFNMVFADGVTRADVVNGDVLQVIAENGNIQEYFIEVQDYKPSHSKLLGTIVWPDIPENFIGKYGWENEMLPGFNSQVFEYSITLPSDYNGIPALLAKPQDIRSKVNTNIVKPTFGNPQNVTIEFQVTAEDGYSISIYKVSIKIQEPHENEQPVVYSEVYRIISGNPVIDTIGFVLPLTTVSSLYSNIIKADPGQYFQVRRSEGNVLDSTDVVNQNDTLIVFSADGVNYSKYIINISQTGLSTNAVIISDLFKIHISASTGLINGFNYGITLKEFMDSITVPSGASVIFLDSNQNSIPYRILNYQDQYINTSVNNNTFLIVTAEDGKTVITYQLLPEFPEDEVFATSDYFYINQEDKIIGTVEPGTTVDVLLANIFSIPGATVKVVDKFGCERTTGPLYPDDVLVVSYNENSYYGLKALSEPITTTYRIYLCKTPPVINVNNLTLNLNSSGYAEIYPSDLDNGSFLGCGNNKLTLSKSKFYCQDNSSQIVTVFVENEWGKIASKDVLISIVCEKPAIIDITGPVDPTALPNVVQLTALYKGHKGLTASWNWGDGNSTKGEIGEFITGTHIYAVPGVFTVNLILYDNFGNSISHDLRYIVVYDPNGNFVTGGGQFFSIKGSSVLYPEATGEASFGFVSKYVKNKVNPDGNTKFKFKAGNLDFKSTIYDWLVVTNSKAIFKGWGTINATGEYGFLISAIDGDIKQKGLPDKFRIKIWEKQTGKVVYDNEMGKDENAESTTELLEGSIVIHESKTKNGSIDSNNEEYSKDEIIVYPNPVNDVIVIEGLHPGISNSLKLVDMNGKVFFIKESKDSQTMIDITEFASGTYVLYIQNNYSIKVHKFIKR